MTKLQTLQTVPSWFVKSSILLYLLVCLPVNAQIVPDATLPNNSSVTTDGNINTITEGTQAGSNLFHSFEQFSIPTGGTAYFNNVANIQNIFSRVTGGSISNINGLIKANGSANLFLVNPNGIVFGSNAKLDIGGSFLGTTANRINFADGLQFSATAPPTTPLLTVSVPVGLVFGSNPKTILVQGNGQGTRLTSDLIDTSIGLRVQPDQTLALVGGNVALEGGTLKTAGGRIELGSVAEPSVVSLNTVSSGWALGYESVPTFGQIQLSGQATVDASGAGGGNIQVQGRQVSLTDGSQIEASALGGAEQGGGALVITATDLVELIGTSADVQFASSLASIAYPKATGDGGNLTLNTSRLSLRDGGQIIISTFGAGSAGSILVNALESAEVVGSAANGSFSSGVFGTVQQGATGKGGNLTVNTGRLSLRDGGRITVSTFGAGSAGSILVNALESAEVVGIRGNRLLPSSFSATVEPEATGKGGNLSINTGRLSIRDGGRITVSTFGTGSAGSILVNALESAEVVGSAANGSFPSGVFGSVRRGAIGNGGNLTVNTGRLSVRDGGQITVSTSGTGLAGNLLINALESAEVVGSTPDGIFGSGIFGTVEQEATGKGGNLTINTRRLSLRDRGRISVDTSGAGSAGSVFVNVLDSIELIGTTADPRKRTGLNAQSRSNGKAGDLRIETGRLSVQNEARVNVSSSGTGDAGNLQVQARSIDLQNSGFLTAETQSGEGGNIALQVQDLLLLRRNSQISTEAGGTGNGGNITINTDTLAALPRENSDISANAFTGNGGKIQINTSGLFGIEPRSLRTPLSDITASSQFGVNGVVSIRNLGFDVQNVITPFAANFISTEQVLANSCLAQRNKQQGRFVVTGNGALPLSPFSSIDEFPYLTGVQVKRQGGRKTQQRSHSSVAPTSSSAPVWKEGDPVVEPEAIIKTADGRTLLGMSPSSVEPKPVSQLVCQGN